MGKENDEEYNPLAVWEEIRKVAVVQVVFFVGLFIAVKTLEELDMERERELDESSEEHSDASSQSAVCSKGKRRRVVYDDGSAELKIAKAIKCVAEAMENGNTAYEKSRARVYSAKEAYDELVAIGVEQHLLLDSYIYLVGNSTRMDAFFGVPHEIRKQFLEHMIEVKAFS